ncbi:hypothetical protein AVEN_162358-1, partial [Araneus ventricosus]
MYKTLKDRLINIFSDSEERRLKKLLQDVELGDKRPSTLLREMQDLAGKREGDSWKPLGFFSRKLSTAEQKYSAYDRELLAIFASIKYFRYLLERTKFTILTDHKPITYAFSQKIEKLSPRQINHLNFIAQFTVDIKHISGKDNVVADALSRIESISTSPLAYEDIARSQQDDEELDLLLKQPISLTLQKLQVPNTDVMLYCDISTQVIRPYIPKTHRYQVFRNLHDLAHPGDSTKYHTVVASVETEILSQVSDIITSPPNNDMYKTLKDRLINIFSDSEERRLKKLLQDVELGDKRPSTLLREMQDLAGKREGDSWKPLGFFSRKLSTAEQKYSAYDRELLAIFASIKYFRYLLERTKFTILTDHKPITYAFSQKIEKLSPRQINHLNFIAQFTVDIKHISGKDNVVADALSRIESISTSPLAYEDIARSQQDDEELDLLLKQPISLTLQKLQVPNTDVMLYCDISTQVIRPYIPKTHRYQVFRNLHDLAHPGVRATVRLI